MTVNPHPDEIRQLVIRVFAEYRVAVRSLFDLHEALLLEEGRCRARSYRSSGLMAIWLTEVGVIQFYGTDGAMLRTVNVLHEVTPQRAAA